jgi:hypothetical protein
VGNGCPTCGLHRRRAGSGPFRWRRFTAAGAAVQSRYWWLPADDRVGSAGEWNQICTRTSDPDSSVRVIKGEHLYGNNGGNASEILDRRHRRKRTSTPRLLDKPRRWRARRTPLDEAPCFARKCYDHLAGRLAVVLASVMQREGVLVFKEERDYTLGPYGEDWLAQLGTDACSAQTQTRRFARRCLDWTERRPRVARTMRQLAAHFSGAGRVKLQTATRAVRVTDARMGWLTDIGVRVTTGEFRREVTYGMRCGEREHTAAACAMTRLGSLCSSAHPTSSPGLEPSGCENCCWNRGHRAESSIGRLGRVEEAIPKEPSAVTSVARSLALNRKGGK